MEMKGSKIINAIRWRQTLRIVLKEGSVHVEPHAYGIDHSGRPLLVCYEVRDGADPASTEGWKTVRLLGAREIEAGPRRFAGPRSGYVRDNPALHTIFAQI